jgi:hypothetical protein
MQSKYNSAKKCSGGRALVFYAAESVIMAAVDNPDTYCQNSGIGYAYRGHR